MKKIVLKSEIVDKIKSDANLNKKIADSLGISERSMPRLLYGNDPKLTQACVLRILKSHLKINKENQLLAEIQMVSV
jgi:hypothetical protein